MDKYDRGLIDAYINSVGGSGGSPCIAPGGLSESTHLRTIEAEYNHFLRAALHDAGLIEMALYWRELIDRQDIGPLLSEDWINPQWGY